jgi:glucosamine--fructose-6-phosphate aminotransferase (isomerizing)
MKWLGKFPDSFAAEIAGQPEALRRATAALCDRRDVLEDLADATAGAGAAVFTGMGSSYDACYPAVNELAAGGILALHVDTAELLHFRSPLLRSTTVLVAVSQSGESAEVVRLVETLAERPERPVVVSITNGSSNALARRADLRLDTRVGPETGPSTMTFAASMAQLVAVADVLAGRPAGVALERARTASEEAAIAIEAILAEAEATEDRLAGAVDGRDVVAVLGRGPARATAEMGALTLKESGVMAESFAALVVATEAQTRALDLGLAAELGATGASVIVLSPDGVAPEGTIGVRVPPADRLLEPAVAIVPIQLLARRLAADRGREPGAYTRASKVTTRE